MQPKSDDPTQQQTNAILKVLPIMIGWFALNVPSALSVYWVVNNIVTTATSVLIRNSIAVEPPKTASASAGGVTMEPPATIFAPPPPKPSGFGSAPSSAPISSDGVKPLTPIDAEVVSDEDEGSEQDEGTSENPKKKRGGKKKGKKRK